MPFSNIRTITEPEWGTALMIRLNEFVVNHAYLSQIAPYSADIFVFTYPIYLLALYLYGIVHRSSYYKEAGLAIVSSAAFAAAINLLFKYFGDKSRPESAIENTDFLILEHLPTNPFPSDHAGVSAAIAMATLLRGVKYDDPLFKRLAVFFWFACLVMSISRVAVAIHRPTDIIVGVGVGIIATYILFYKPVRRRYKRTVINPLIRFEQFCCKAIFGYDQTNDQ